MNVALRYWLYGGIAVAAAAFHFLGGRHAEPMSADRDPASAILRPGASAVSGSGGTGTGASTGGASPAGTAQPATSTPSVSNGSAAPRTVRSQSEEPRAPTAVMEFLRARDLRSFYDRWVNVPNPSGEVKALLAQALEECRRYTRQGGASGFRDRATAFMTGPDPGSASRGGALEQTLARCAGFEGMSITDDMVNRLWQEAEAAGDPRALTRKFLAMWMTKPDDKTLVESARPLLMSKDPRVIEELGGVIANRSPRVQLAGGERPAPQAWTAAWQLAACQFGSDCGAAGRAALTACWRDGVCGTGSSEEALARTVLSGEQYQAALRYRDMIVNAIESGDLGALGLGDSPNGANWRFARFGAQNTELSNRVGATVRVTQSGSKYRIIIESDNPSAIEAVLNSLQ